MRDALDPIHLKILFSPAPSGAALRWEADVIGVRHSRMALPYAAADLPLLLRALDVLQDPYYPLPWTGTQAAAFSFSPPEQAQLADLGLWDPTGRVRIDAPRMVGRGLFRAITADPSAARALGTARDHAAALDRPLSLHLCFQPAAVQLAALPWELLWDDSPAPLAFSRFSGFYCQRHLDLAQALPPPRPAGDSLRVLVVSPQADIPPELRQVERAARMAALDPLIASGRLHVDEISPATRPALLHYLETMPPPDIVHYYGHGAYTGSSGTLLLDAADGQGAWTGTEAIAALFSQARLVLLHACQGALSLPEAPAQPLPLLTGIAPALSAAGVPLVIAMQLSVRTEAATIFSAALYQGLAAGQSVPAAMAAGRRALFVSEDDQLSWFVPVLYVRSRRIEPAYLEQPPEAATRPPGPLQSIVARGGAAVRGLWMRGRRQSSQQVIAESGAAIVGAQLDAAGSSRQRLEATEGAGINGVRLEGNE
jgi:hypothetical protein